MVAVAVVVGPSGLVDLASPWVDLGGGSGGVLVVVVCLGWLSCGGDVGVSRATARCPLLPRVGACQIGISGGCGCWFQPRMKILISMNILISDISEIYR